MKPKAISLLYNITFTKLTKQLDTSTKCSIYIDKHAQQIAPNYKAHYFCEESGQNRVMCFY